MIVKQEYENNLKKLEQIMSYLNDIIVTQFVTISWVNKSVKFSVKWLKKNQKGNNFLLLVRQKELINQVGV